MKVFVPKGSIEEGPGDQTRAVFLKISFEINAITTSLMDERRSIIGLNTSEKEAKCRSRQEEEFARPINVKSQFTHPFFSSP
jgi:hypothetical protein